MKEKAARTRLDLLLVERKLAESPEKAAAVILAGEVQVDGQRLDKAGTLVARAAKIEVASRHQKYVSRGGHKLFGTHGVCSFPVLKTECKLSSHGHPD